MAMNTQTVFEKVTSSSVLPFKRVATTTTKDSNTSYDSSSYLSYFSSPSYNQQHEIESSSSSDSSQTSHGIDDDYASLVSTRQLTDDDTIPSSPREDKIEKKKRRRQRKQRVDYTDNILDTNTKNRTLSLAWDRGNKVASSFRIGLSKNSIVDDVHGLPEGISKSDITVLIDFDDEARSSLASELDDEDLDVEILDHAKYHSGNGRKENLQQRRDFEETVRQGILDDLSSVYTAKSNDAKYVLCVLISVLSDGTLDHTFWSGGRVGLTEIILQFVMFDADDLQVYKRGRVIEKKDFGFGPLGLTENEGQQYLATILAPRATNQIIRKIGKGSGGDLMAEF